MQVAEAAEAEAAEAARTLVFSLARETRKHDHLAAGARARLREESASKPRKEGVVARDLETMRRHEETEESIAALKNLDETLAAKSAPEPSS